MKQIKIKAGRASENIKLQKYICKNTGKTFAIKKYKIVIPWTYGIALIQM